MAEESSRAVRELVDRLDELVQELRQLSTTLQSDSDDLQRLFHRWVDPRDHESQLTVEQQRQLLTSVERRIRAALRAHRAADDLQQISGIQDPELAFTVAESWFPESRLYRRPLEEYARSVITRGADIAGLERGSHYFTTGRSFISNHSPGSADSIWAAARYLLGEAGYEVLVEGLEESGSIWKGWALRGSTRAASKLAEASAAAVHDTYLRKPGAQATLALAQSAAQLITAMGEQEGVHQFDNVIIGKFRGPDGCLRSFSRELSLSERRALESNPSMLREPASLLDRLNQLPEVPEPPPN
jgi:hypothetical protein